MLGSRVTAVAAAAGRAERARAEAAPASSRVVIVRRIWATPCRTRARKPEEGRKERPRSPKIKRLHRRCEERALSARNTLQPRRSDRLTTLCNGRVTRSRGQEIVVSREGAGWRNQGHPSIAARRRV